MFSKIYGLSDAKAKFEFQYGAYTVLAEKQIYDKQCDASIEISVCAAYLCTEFTTVHKSRDNHLKSRDNHLKSRDNHLKSRDDHLKSRDDHLKSRDDHLKSRDDHLKSRDDHLKSRDTHHATFRKHPFSRPDINQT
ncbi:DUF3552 domain-containing protein [Lentibacillus sp. CBA3610]|nr:DUF3552 domain-containing protein [Lentibacillus sp. CBA3610]